MTIGAPLKVMGDKLGLEGAGSVVDGGDVVLMDAAGGVSEGVVKVES